MIVTATLAIFMAYLLGSIPSGLWLGQLIRGVDIREHGSKNIGATNALRVLGKGMGAVALLSDIGKGIAAVLLVSRLSAWEYAPLACGVAAILGHTLSVFCRFKGGKGVATSAGVFAAFCPLPTAIAAVVFLAVVIPTRMVSAGSCMAAAGLAVSVWLMPPHLATAPSHILPGAWTPRILATAILILVLVRHQSNIKRILKGEENKL